MDLLRDAWLQTPTEQKESWEEFEAKQKVLKYSNREPLVAWQDKKIAENIANFKNPDFKYQDAFKLNCEDFWKKSDDPRRNFLYGKMHPLIFLKEQTPAYQKI